MLFANYIKSPIAGWIAITALITLSLFVQFHAIIGHDVGWHIHVASRIMAGEELYKDIFEVNFPLIHYIKIIPLWFADIYGASVIPAVNIFHSLIGVLSLYLSFYWLRTAKKDGLTINAYIIAAALVIFILPFFMVLNKFGQKEHLYIMLTLPYFFLSLCEEKEVKSKRNLLIFTGLLAGLGFSIKPFFVISFIALEIYLGITKKRWLRPENIAAATAGILHLFFILSTAYISEILPITRELYIQSLDPVNLFFHAMYFTKIYAAPLLIVPVLMLLGMAKDSMIFALILLAGVVSAALQLKGWEHHLYPINAMGILLFISISFELFSGYKKAKKSRKKKDERRTLTYLTLPVYFCIMLYLGFTVIGESARGIKHMYANSNNPIYRSTIPLADYLARNFPKGSSVFIISERLAHAYPTILYSGNESHFKFPSLWLLDRVENYKILAAEKAVDEKDIARKAEMIEDFLKKNVTNYLINYKPKILVVPLDNHKTSNRFIKEDINYIKYFSQHPIFAEEIKKYSLKKKLKTEWEVFAIYERK